MTTFLKDSQQSVFHHERAPTQELERKQFTPQRALQGGENSETLPFRLLLLPKFECIVFLGAYAPGGMLFPLFVLDASVFCFVISWYWVGKEVSRGSGSDEYQ